NIYRYRVMIVSTTSCFSFSRVPRDLHSFPTRRSSDLQVLVGASRSLDKGRGLDRVIHHESEIAGDRHEIGAPQRRSRRGLGTREDRKSTRLNSSHVATSYAVFCLKKKKTNALRFTGSE